MGEGQVLQPCSTNWSGESTHLHAAESHRHTARALGGKLHGCFGAPAHATQAAWDTAGGEKRLLLVFPQQSRNKHTMATSPLCSEAQGSERLSAVHGPELGDQAQVWLCRDSTMAPRWLHGGAQFTLDSSRWWRRQRLGQGAV